jgi:prepilin-type N-terminal cleavage/methylation domain-containing protein
MVTTKRLSKRPQRAGERGFTLIEVVVSIAILAVIGSIIATVFGVGVQVVAKGGPKDRLTGAHDFMVLEQTLGKDAARAACVQVADTVYGGTTCASSFGHKEIACGSSAVLCIGWPDVGESSCHVAAYVTAGIVTRREYRVSGAGIAVVESGPLTEDTVNLVFGSPTEVTAPGRYPWLRSLPVSVTATGVSAGQFSQTLILHPVATDPGGAASAITAQGNPC